MTPFVQCPNVQYCRVATSCLNSCSLGNDFKSLNWTTAHHCEFLRLPNFAIGTDGGDANAIRPRLESDTHESESRDLILFIETLYTYVLFRYQCAIYFELHCPVQRDSRRQLQGGRHHDGIRSW